MSRIEECHKILATMINNGYTIAEIANKTKISYMTIKNLIENKTRRVTDPKYKIILAQKDIAKKDQEIKNSSADSIKTYDDIALAELKKTIKYLSLEAFMKENQINFSEIDENNYDTMKIEFEKYLYEVEYLQKKAINEYNRMTLKMKMKIQEIINEKENIPSLRS